MSAARARKAPVTTGARKRPRRWAQGILLGVAAIGLAFALGYLVAYYLLFPKPAETGAGVAVPELAGLERAAGERVVRSRGLVVLDVVELPHPREKAGVIIAQSPLPGQQLRPGAGVRFAVSAGRSRAMLPDVRGEPAARARARLERLGFEVEVVEDTTPLPPGLVLSMTPEPGRERELPARVTLRVGVAPPRADTLPPTLPDTAGQPPVRPDTTRGAG